MTWPSHPDDEYVDVTTFGDADRQVLRSRSYIGDAVAKARAEYVGGQIGVDEFERRLDEALEEASNRPQRGADGVWRWPKRRAGESPR